MKALTLWPEWAHAICHYGKDLENRDWAPPMDLIGRRIAIHAGVNVGGRPGQAATEAGMDALSRMTWRWAGGRVVYRQHLQATWARLQGLRGDRDRPIVRGAIVATAVLAEVLDGREPRPELPWGVPESLCWWRLADVHVLTRAVPCRGAQGLWTVPNETLVEVLRG